MTPEECVNKCEREQLCTGPAGKGLQQLTNFGEDKEAPQNGRRHTFEAVPTAVAETRVFATGQCYECKLGHPDKKFRCAAFGRREKLARKRRPPPYVWAEKQGNFEKIANDRRIEVDMAIRAALFAGPEVCFSQHLAQHLPDKHPDKRGVTIVVCNERLEYTECTEDCPSDMFHGIYPQKVRYAGSMAVVGGFKPSFTGGLSDNDMDLRLFDFGITIFDDNQPSFPIVYDTSHLATSFSGRPMSCPLFEPMDGASSYRGAVAELYGRYVRARARAKAAVAPCLPNPTMDFRETVDPSTQEIKYAKVMIFGKPVPTEPEDSVGFKSNRQFFPCGERGLLTKGSGLKCGSKKKDGAARLAQLQAGGMQFDSGSEQGDMVAKLDGVVTYVMRAMAVLSKEDKGHWSHLRDCDEGFWAECTKSGACLEGGNQNWGVLDEHVYTNTEVQASEGSGHALIVPKAKSGTPMYGGSVCVAAQGRAICLQYAVPQDLVTQGTPVDVDGGKKVDPGTVEYWDFPPHRQQVAIYVQTETDSKAGTKCRTGDVEGSVRYYFQKRITAAWMETKAGWSENKCVGAEIK
jgi:hypothetical protein